MKRHIGTALLLAVITSAGAWAQAPSAANRSEIEQIRQEMRQLQEQLSRLNERLEQALESSPQTAAAPASSEPALASTTQPATENVPGVRPALGGLENIRFNLLVNGADPSEIPHLTEEIVEFTELGAFIRAPVRTYSSGMRSEEHHV